jgi:metal-sulfur cluster biosynthetic enzyme
MTMTTPACPLREYIQTLVESAIAERVAGVERVEVDIVSEPPWSEEMMSEAARRQIS